MIRILAFRERGGQAATFQCAKVERSDIGSSGKNLLLSILWKLFSRKISLATLTMWARPIRGWKGRFKMFLSH